MFDVLPSFCVARRCEHSCHPAQTGRIGDLIPHPTTPVIAALREKFPKARIGLVVYTAPAAELTASKSLELTGYSSRAVASLVSRTGSRSLSGDTIIVLDFTRTDRSALLAILSHARKRVTYERANAPAKWRSLVYDEFIKDSARSMHTVDHHLAHLTSLGIHDSSSALALRLPNESRGLADRILGKAGVPSSFVIFHPGSARIEKILGSGTVGGIDQSFCGTRRQLRPERGRRRWNKRTSQRSKADCTGRSLTYQARWVFSP